MLNNQTLPESLRHLAAGWVRWWEKRANPHVNHYLLAEQCYRDEFPHLSNVTVLENKYNGAMVQGSPISFDPEKPIQFIIAGTLTQVYGIAEGMRWFIQFNTHFPLQTLHVIGHCPMRSYRKKLEDIAKDLPQIKLELSESPIQFSRIHGGISKSDCWLMPYQLLPSISTKMPTKLYEGIARRKVVLISENTLWEKMLTNYSAGLSIDFHKEAWTKSEMESLYRNTFFTAKPDGSILWSGETPKLLSVIESLLKN